MMETNPKPPARLRHIETLIYYDQPILVVAIDDGGQYYLCLLVDEKEDQYSCCAISEKEITDIKTMPMVEIMEGKGKGLYESKAVICKIEF